MPSITKYTKSTVIFAIRSRVALHIADYFLENFRQTLSYRAPTRRGFFVDIDTENQRVTIRFDSSNIMQLQGFSLEKFLCCIREGNILIDFDARTGHNHGTKFRIRPDAIPSLYRNSP
ncbi:MAG: hypothetical protein IJG36_07295 [Synergistaceae bacterium]|nr:hypothetical protein [Synergistaceae bacterium]